MESFKGSPIAVLWIIATAFACILLKDLKFYDLAIICGFVGGSVMQIIFNNI